MKEIAPRIVVDEKVAFGKPVIKGTHVLGCPGRWPTRRRHDL